MTNYDVYFGTQERALDTLMLLIDYANYHPRAEVREFQAEVRNTKSTKWLKQECTDKRWFANSFGMKDNPVRALVQENFRQEYMTNANFATCVNYISNDYSENGKINLRLVLQCLSQLSCKIEELTKQEITKTKGL